MNYDEHTRFPFRRCIIATVVIILCFLMILVLLYSLVNSDDMPDSTFIIPIVWAVCLVVFIAGYWIYQYIRYKKTRNDEK